MKLITLNLRNNADRWEERFPLVIKEILQEMPDVIAFQEVALSIEQASIIASALNSQLNERHYQSYLVKGWGPEASLGEAILTRCPQTRYKETRLPEGGRVAQLLSINDGEKRWDIVNTHLHHLPQDDETIRFQQIHYLLDWMFCTSIEDPAWILLGDLNATPHSKTIQYILNNFNSAYFSIHGTEPEFTFPTPLVQEKGDWNLPRTIDYIFYSPSVYEIQEAHLAFTTSHPKDKTLFPSDHFGIAATISQKR